MSRLLAAVRAGAHVEWVPLAAGWLDVEVMAAPLRVDGVAYSCTPIEAQQCADLLGACLLTPKLADLAWLAADVRLSPHTHPVGWGRHDCPGCGASGPGPWELCWECGSKQRSDAELSERNVKLRGIGPLSRTPLVAGWGKPWALAASCFVVAGRIGQPYGWYSDNAPSMSATGCSHVWQPVGRTAPHDGTQRDYAEPLVLWRPVGRTLADVWADPKLRAEVCHDRPPHWRLPGVPIAE